MQKKLCLACGSSNLIADRSLAGRIVCASCGSTDIGRRSKYNKNSFSKLYLFIFLFLMTFLIIIII